MAGTSRNHDKDNLFLEVAVAAPLQETLTYSAHLADFSQLADTASELFVGRRVLVPLGGRKVTGYVLSISGKKDAGFTVRSIIDLLDTIPLFHSNLVPFFSWIADYYHHPIGQVIQTALPGGLIQKSGKQLVVQHFEIDKPLQWTDVKNIEPDWFKKLRLKGELTQAETTKVLKEKKSRKIIDRLVDGRLIQIEERLRKETAREKWETCYRVINLSDTEKKRVGGGGFKEFSCHIKEKIPVKFSAPELKCLYYVKKLGREQKDHSVSLKDLRKCYSTASTKILEGLKKKSLIEDDLVRIFRNPLGDRHIHVEKPDTLTGEQRQVLEQLIPAIKNKRYKPFLLHGVTGCGKTEVYLQCASETLAQGRDVLVLVPEIALATQLEAGFVSRFGDQVVLLHSGLTAGERFDQWWRAATSDARIVIGARSALFAPLKDIGLIVVDEEHDAGFKQDDSLRYQARDLSLLRGRFQQSVVLLGSATPSVSSYYHAKTGKYTLLSMKKRVDDRPLPFVHIVDLKKKKILGSKKLFSEKLKEGLIENFERSKQSMLLLNRRGFSTSMLCQECGSVVECQHCHVSLTYHKKKNSLICHYCGFQQRTNVVCEACRCEKLVPVGFGTERVEEELKDLLPEARIERLDSDSAADRRGFLKILKKMRDREIDVLIGTQMIAKGHHFPHVTLVGVVWADGGLSMPDYKASEKTFQLLTQVTGRAGRGEEPGEVIIQTMHPDHYAVSYARDHLYEELFEHEVSIRESIGFPPFVRMINIKIHGEIEFDVRKTATKVGSFCRSWIQRTGNALQIMGPSPSPIDRLRGQFRWQLLLKGKDVVQLHKLCGSIIHNKKRLIVGKAMVKIDVDPENMM